MVWTHPQWRRAADICRSGRLGTLQSYIGVFTSYNDNPADLSNIAAFGGGGLMDIGCYLIVTSRMLFGEDPVRAAGAIVRDPVTGVDTLTSMTLEFPSGHAIGTCGIRTARHQRVQMLGSAGRLEVETPFRRASDRPLRCCSTTAATRTERAGKSSRFRRATRTACRATPSRAPCDPAPTRPIRSRCRS
jgi:predicted dehydrogenase